MTKIAKKFNPRFPHFKKRKQVKRKHKYFLIISRKITKHGCELKSNCVLMKSTSKMKLEAVKLIEINRCILKKYSKRIFLYPVNKKMKHPWELVIPLALLKEVKKVINAKPKKVVIKNNTEPDKIDEGEEIQECDEDSIDTEDMIITISSSSSECTSPVKFLDDNENIDNFTTFESQTKYFNNQMEVKCQFCDMKFKQLRSLHVHVKRAHSCTQCDILFKCKETLDEHLKIHDVSTSFPHKCLECNKSFSNLLFLSRHEERHAIKAKQLIDSKQSKYPL